jgi:hypothetical protein
MADRRYNPYSLFSEMEQGASPCMWGTDRMQ